MSKIVVIGGTGLNPSKPVAILVGVTLALLAILSVFALLAAV
jgi:hypothetical protein